MAQRGENIYLRKDGRWEGRYIKGHDPGKKAIYGYVYAKRYQECKEKLIHAKSLYMNINRTIKTCGNGSVSEFMIYWLHNFVRQSVKVSTFSNYTSMMEKWINPFLGDKRLSKIGKEEIQFFINFLSEQGLSAGVIRNIYRLLYAAMRKAQEYNYLHTNPCKGANLPPMEKKEARLLSIPEQKKLEQVAKKDKNGFVVMLAIYTGLRVGEICALKWNDVDLGNGTIRVSQTMRRIKNDLPGTTPKTVIITGSAKSLRSMRIIPLPSCIIELFHKHKNISENDYVFTHRDHPLEPRLLQYRFKALLKKAELEDINFHALRHTFATRCMELCVDIKTLSEILGHSSAKLTLDRYGHSQLEHKKAVMKNLDRLFEQSA